MVWRRRLSLKLLLFSLISIVNARLPTCANGQAPKLNRDGQIIQCLPGNSQTSVCGKNHNCYFTGLNYMCCPTNEPTPENLPSCPSPALTVLDGDGLPVTCSPRTRQCPSENMYCSDVGLAYICCESPLISEIRSEIEEDLTTTTAKSMSAEYNGKMLRKRKKLARPLVSSEIEKATIKSLKSTLHSNAIRVKPSIGAKPSVEIFTSCPESSIEMLDADGSKILCESDKQCNGFNAVCHGDMRQSICCEKFEYASSVVGKDASKESRVNKIDNDNNKRMENLKPKPENNDEFDYEEIIMEEDEDSNDSNESHGRYDSHESNEDDEKQNINSNESAVLKLKSEEKDLGNDDFFDSRLSVMTSSEKKPMSRKMEGSSFVESRLPFSPKSISVAMVGPLKPRTTTSTIISTATTTTTIEPSTTTKSTDEALFTLKSIAELINRQQQFVEKKTPKSLLKEQVEFRRSMPHNYQPNELSSSVRINDGSIHKVNAEDDSLSENLDVKIEEEFNSFATGKPLIDDIADDTILSPDLFPHPEETTTTEKPTTLPPAVTTSWTWATDYTQKPTLPTGITRRRMLGVKTNAVEDDTKFKFLEPQTLPPETRTIESEEIKKQIAQRYLMHQIRNGWPYDERFYRPDLNPISPEDRAELLRLRFIAAHI